MRLPENLREAIASEAARAGSHSLMRASAELTESYKSAEFASPALRSDTHRLAYLMVRMPATYAANVHVLRQLQRTVPAISPCTVLDIGAGPGTSSWAVAEVFPAVQRFTLLERDLSLLALGKRLAARSERSFCHRAEWRPVDLTQLAQPPTHDLVICSYLLGELPADFASKLIRAAWGATQQALVLIEPGTRRGFETILRARSELLSSGATIAAPCPHDAQCPMAAAGDWCHFSQRIERTVEHRRLKDGSLGYEDEKFSYLVASRLAVQRPRARIVRHPLKFSGHITFQLCSGPDLENKTVTRSQKAAYKSARKADWGGAWND